MNRLVEVLLLWAAAFFYGGAAIIGVFTQIYKIGLTATFKKNKRSRPKCLDDPTLGTHGFLHLENLKIHYVASGPEDKPLMLFVHGFPEFWYSWRYQIREFQKDYRCVAIDQRGYGESDKPADLEVYRMDHLMTDLKQIITALGYKSCTLVAHDWGGAVAWAFGRNFPDMVDNLICMNIPPSPVMKKMLKTNKVQMKMSWYMFFFQLPYLPEFILGLYDLGIFDQFSTKGTKMFVNPIPKEDVEAYKYTFSQPGSWTPPLNYYRAALQLDPFMFDLEFSIPILLIWGLKDSALCSDNPDETQKLIPKMTLKKIEDAAHFVQMDTPDLVNQTMREWLSSQK